MGRRKSRGAADRRILRPQNGLGLGEPTREPTLEPRDRTTPGIEHDFRRLGRQHLVEAKDFCSFVSRPPLRSGPTLDVGVARWKEKHVPTFSGTQHEHCVGELHPSEIEEIRGLPVGADIAVAAVITCAPQHDCPATNLLGKPPAALAIDLFRLQFDRVISTPHITVSHRYLPSNRHSLLPRRQRRLLGSRRHMSKRLTPKNFD